MWASSDFILSPILRIKDRQTNLFVQGLVGLLPLLLFFCSNLSSTRGVVVDRELRENTKDEDLITVDNLAILFGGNEGLANQNQNGQESILLLDRDKLK
jgi:hypothetical protein